jgi:CRP-like cAMP-binding protein
MTDQSVTKQSGEHACNRTPEQHSLSSTIGSWPRCPKRDQRQILSHCDSVELRRGEVISEPGERIRDVYFPTDSFVSLVTPPEDHAGLEVRLVGNEGMIGTPLILGVEVTQIRTLVQGAGPAWRLSSEGFGEALRQSDALRARLHRYLDVLMNQSTQLLACTRFHRWRHASPAGC